MARPIEHLRADAARNVQRIVEVAACQLGADPGAGMAEVAVAAGVSRATVYRHFPTREALIHAIHAQAVEQSERALEDSRLGEDVEHEPNIRRVVMAFVNLAAGIGNVAGGFLSAVERAGEFGREVLALAESIPGFFAALPEQMAEIGRQIIDGLWNGLKSKFTGVKDGLVGLATDMVDGVKSRWGIESPSKVFRALGENIMQGLGLGIADTADAADGPLGNALGNLEQQFSGFFQGVLFEGKNFREELSSLLSGLGGRLLDSGISALFGGFKIPGFANGTSFAPGGLAMVGERGPELANLPRGSRVTPNHRLPEGGGGLTVNIEVNGARGNAEIREMVAAGVRTGLTTYDRRVLPGRMAEISRDPSRRF